jgi:hypothetical protein
MTTVRTAAEQQARSVVPGRVASAAIPGPHAPRLRSARSSRLLADRGWGKAAAYEPLEGDPLDLTGMEEAAEEFRARILRLAADSQSDTELRS